MMRMRVCLALPAAPMRARLFRKKIDVHLLAADQPFKLGDARARLGECRALVLLRLQRLELAGTWFRHALAVQPLRTMGLPRLDPVMKEFARYPKLAGHRQNAFATFSALDRLQFVRRRILTAFRSCCHRSSS